MATENDGGPRGQERRSNAALRQLVDEMLAQVRTAAARASWSQEERQAAERDLERIMASVRDEAIRRDTDAAAR